jgi:hypothetical protein
MCGTQTGDEVIFERLDCPFCPVAPMETCWGELKFDVFSGDKFLKELGGLIVKAMKLRMETMALEESKDFLVRCFDGLFFAIGYGFSVD